MTITGPCPLGLNSPAACLQFRRHQAERQVTYDLPCGWTVCELYRPEPVTAAPPPDTDTPPPPTQTRELAALVETYTVEALWTSEHTGRLEALLVELIATSERGAIARTRGTLFHARQDAGVLSGDFTVVDVRPFERTA